MSNNNLFQNTFNNLGQTGQQGQQNQNQGQQNSLFGIQQNQGNLQNIRPQGQENNSNIFLGQSSFGNQQGQNQTTANIFGGSTTPTNNFFQNQQQQPQGQTGNNQPQQQNNQQVPNFGTQQSQQQQNGQNFFNPIQPAQNLFNISAQNNTITPQNQNQQFQDKGFFSQQGNQQNQPQSFLFNNNQQNQMSNPAKQNISNFQQNQPQLNTQSPFQIQTANNDQAQQQNTNLIQTPMSFQNNQNQNKQGEAPSLFFANQPQQNPLNQNQNQGNPSEAQSSKNQGINTLFQQNQNQQQQTLQPNNQQINQLFSNQGNQLILENKSSLFSNLTQGNQQVKSNDPVNILQKQETSSFFQNIPNKPSDQIQKQEKPPIENLFGKQEPKTGGILGNQQKSGELFGNIEANKDQKPAATGGLFGKQDQKNMQAGGLFGINDQKPTNLNNDQGSEKIEQKGLFGNNDQKPTNLNNDQGSEKIEQKGLFGHQEITSNKQNLFKTNQPGASIGGDLFKNSNNQTETKVESADNYTEQLSNKKVQLDMFSSNKPEQKSIFEKKSADQNTNPASNLFSNKPALDNPKSEIFSNNPAPSNAEQRKQSNPTFAQNSENPGQKKIEKIIFKSKINIQKRDQYLKQAHLSARNLLNLIEDSIQEISILLLNDQKIVEKLVNTVRTLEYTQESSEALQRLNFGLKQEQISQILQKEGQGLHVNLNFIVYVVTGILKENPNFFDDFKQESLNELRKVITQELEIERLTLLKCTYFYLKNSLADNETQFQVRHLFKQQDLLIKLFTLLQQTKRQDEVILIYKCLIIGMQVISLPDKFVNNLFEHLIQNYDPGFVSQEESFYKLEEMNQKKQNLQEITIFLLVQCINVHYVCGHIYQDDAQISERINNYYQSLVPLFDQKLKEVPHSLECIQTLWMMVAAYMKKNNFSSFASVQVKDFQPENLDRIIYLIKGDIYQEERFLYSYLIRNCMSICLNFYEQVIPDHCVEKYVRFFSKLCKNNEEIKRYFWGREIFQGKGFGALFLQLKNHYPRQSQNLCKMARSGVSPKFTGQIIEIFSQLDVCYDDIQDIHNVWNEIYRDWVVFLKQLINNQSDHHISTKLPIISFIKLICQIIIQEPSYFKDFEYVLTDHNSKESGGYVLTLILVDTLVYFQKIKNPPLSLLSMIIDALRSIFRFQDLRETVCQVISMYSLTIQSQMNHHPFFEVINLLKSDQVIMEDNNKQHRIFYNLTDFFLTVIEYSDHLLSDFPDEAYFKRNKEANQTQTMQYQIADFVIQNMHAFSQENDIQYWNAHETNHLNQLFRKLTYKMFSTFIPDFLGYIYNYLLPMLKQGRFRKQTHYKIGTRILEITKLILQKYQINVQRIPLYTHEQENPLLQMFNTYLNNSSLLDVLFSTVEIEVIIDRYHQKFENKMYNLQRNLVNLNSCRQEDKLVMTDVQSMILSGLGCMIELTGLIDIFIENQVQQLNLQYIGSLQIVSQLGQILCFKEKMHNFREFFQANNQVLEFNINLILALANHIPIFKDVLPYQIQPQLTRNLIGIAQNKAMILQESISINALKLLSKIVLLWQHMPAQKQPKLFDLFQEISNSQGKTSLLNLIQLYLIQNLEDFQVDIHCSIAALEFFILCMENQKQFLNLFIKNKQKDNQFSNEMNHKLLKFVYNSIEYCNQDKSPMTVLFYSKLVVFINQSIENNFQYTELFLKSDFFPGLLDRGLDLLMPSLSYNQLFQEDPLKSQNTQKCRQRVIPYQQKISFELQKRFAMASLSELITGQLLLKNLQVSKALSQIFRKKFQQFVEYFSGYGHSNFFIKSKENFLLDLYSFISEKNPTMQPMLEYKLARCSNYLQSDLVNNCDSNSFGFGRDYLIDSQELFYLLKQIGVSQDEQEFQVQNVQNQNLIQSLIDMDNTCFNKMKTFYNILCSIVSEEGHLFSALYPNYKELQNLFKQDLSYLNPNDDIKLGTNLVRIMDQAESVELFINEIIKTINQKYLPSDQTLSDAQFIKFFKSAQEMLIFSFLQAKALGVHYKSKYIFQQDVLNSTLTFITKTLQSNLSLGFQDDNIVILLQIFMDFISINQETNLVKYHQIFELFQLIAEFLQKKDQNTIGYLNFFLQLVKIDAKTFLQKPNYQLLQILNNKMQISSVDEQIIIIQILTTLLNCDFEERGINLLKNNSSPSCVINCNNLNFIEKEEYYKDNKKIKLYNLTLTFVRDYLLITQGYDSNSASSLYAPFMKSLYPRVISTLKNCQDQNISFQLLDELKHLMQVIALLLNQSFSLAYQNEYSTILQNLFNVQFIFASNIQPKNQEEQDLYSIVGLEKNIFQYLIQQYQLEIWENLAICFKNGLLNIKNFEQLDINDLEQFLEMNLGMIVWGKKMKQKQNSQERDEKELQKKANYLGYQSWSSSVGMQTWFEVVCMGIERYQDFRQFAYQGNFGDVTKEQKLAERIGNMADDIEKLFYIGSQRNQYLNKFEKNDESSWSIYQIFKNYLIEQVEW